MLLTLLIHFPFLHNFPQKDRKSWCLLYLSLALETSNMVLSSSVISYNTTLRLVLSTSEGLVIVMDVEEQRMLPNLTQNKLTNFFFEL